VDGKEIEWKIGNFLALVSTIKMPTEDFVVYMENFIVQVVDTNILIFQVAFVLDSNSTTSN